MDGTNTEKPLFQDEIYELPRNIRFQKSRQCRKPTAAKWIKDCKEAGGINNYEQESKNKN